MRARELVSFALSIGLVVAFGCGCALSDGLLAALLAAPAGLLPLLWVFGADTSSEARRVRDA